MTAAPILDESPALLTRTGRVATITLNRPQAFNALDMAMARRLAELGRQVADDDDASVLVIRGSGPGFCSGGDIGLFADNLDAIGDAVGALLDAYHPFLILLGEMPKLVLSSVHGAAAGAGLSLALMGDLCIAGEGARFRASYAGLGVSPDGGGTVGLVDAVGARAAMRIFLGEDQLDARQALAAGLVDRLVPDAHLDAATAEWAAQIAEIEPIAIAATKALVRRRAGGDVSAQLDAEKQALIRCMETETFRERVLAFLRGE